MIVAVPATAKRGDAPRASFSRGRYGRVIRIVAVPATAKRGDG